MALEEILHAGHDGTHGRRRDVISPGVFFQHLNDGVVMSCVERSPLSGRVEISTRVCDWSSSDPTIWQERGATVPFPDDPQNGRGYGRSLVSFYDPRFVPLHANRRIITNLDSPLVLVRVYRETAGLREGVAKSDEGCLNGRPLSGRFVRMHDGLGVEANALAVVSPPHCMARVRHEEYEKGRRDPTAIGDC